MRTQDGEKAYRGECLWTILGLQGLDAPRSRTDEEGADWGVKHAKKSCGRAEHLPQRLDIEVTLVPPAT